MPDILPTAVEGGVLRARDGQWVPEEAGGGIAGEPGDSAFEVAVANGFTGSEAQWLASLVGELGQDGTDGTNGSNGAAGQPGDPGADGRSAYEVTVDNGFVGSEAAWLASLIGADGADGATGPPGTTLHAALSDVSSNQHHAENHVSRHATAGADPLAPASIGAAPTSHSHVDGDLPAGIARDSEVTAAVAAHEGAGDPHPTYSTATEATALADASVATHAGLSDPHTGYQRESEKAAASGYASLDGATKVPIAQLPTGTSGSTVAFGDAAAALDAAHAAAADPHTGYQKESEKGSANGYAGLGAGGLVPIAQLASGTPNGLKFIRDDGTLVTPGGGDDARLVLKRLASQQDSSATTPAKVTGLDQTLGVGTWVVEYFIRWRTSLAATGVKFDLNHSGTVTSFVWNQRQFDIAATASTAVPDQDNVQAAGAVMMGFSSRAKGTAGRGVLLSADTVNLDMLTIIEALVEVTVSGDIQLYFGSEATGSTQSVMVGSVLRATKVA